MRKAKSALLLVGCLSLATAGLSAVSYVHAEAAPATQPAADATPVNKMCPVSGDAIDPKVTTTYNGKTYAFCCKDCVKSFNKDPEKYAAKAK